MTDERLRLILVSDGVGELDRVLCAVREAVAGGCRCVQLREPRWSAAEVWSACMLLKPVLDAVGGLLLVNDRVDVAVAGGASGAQVGYRSLPPAAARTALGPERVLGYSAHSSQELEVAADAGCDFALLSPIWPTSCKPDRAPLGLAAAGRMTEAARVPVVWLGGVTASACDQIAALPSDQRPAGVAVRSAIMLAEGREQAVHRLIESLQR